MSITILLLLYYIFNLHQTTTSTLSVLSPQRLYYIFNLHQTTTLHRPSWPLRRLYYIFNLHQTTTECDTGARCTRCIISLIYIKPQQSYDYIFPVQSCIISLIYIKPQRRADYALVMRRLRGNCICRKPYVRTPAKRLWWEFRILRTNILISERKSKFTCILPSGSIFDDVKYRHKRWQKQTCSHFAGREYIRLRRIEYRKSSDRKR